MVVGNLVGRRCADRLLYAALAAGAVVLALFTVTAHHRLLAAVTIPLIGALGFATVPPLQKRVLGQASGAPTLVSAVNIGAFDLGNTLSTWPRLRRGTRLHDAEPDGGRGRGQLSARRAFSTVTS